MTTNRTTLELKRQMRQWNHMKIQLPIAPHWNWNLVCLSNSITLNCSTNRTTLELKQSLIGWSDPWIDYQSHHTGIETSFLSHIVYIVNLATNRTTLELKPMKPVGLIAYLVLPIAPHWNWNIPLLFHLAMHHNLPIAPHWNWNILSRSLAGAGTHYQSHHTGIETNKTWLHPPTKRCYQSHHTGIETR